MVMFMLNIGFDTSGSDEDVVALQESYFWSGNHAEKPTYRNCTRCTRLKPGESEASALDCPKPSLVFCFKAWSCRHGGNVEPEGALNTASDLLCWSAQPKSGPNPVTGKVDHKLKVEKLMIKKNERKSTKKKT